ncbi:phage tail protein [Agrobacterium rhizogenes]|nr:phage tail protein [Rhizobium rhizogenes]NTI99274.1 phage tail protein [Rhizobium rhizogenes]
MPSVTSMMLGGYAFEALGFGYQNIKRKVNTPWVEIPVGQTLNPQQWTGPTSDEVTIQGVLFPEEFGGQSQLDGIIAASMAGTEMMLVSGDAMEGVIRGMFTVQSVEEDQSYHDARGAPRRNAYVISLKRSRAETATGAGGVVDSASSFLSNLFR